MKSVTKILIKIKNGKITPKFIYRLMYRVDQLKSYYIMLYLPSLNLELMHSFHLVWSLLGSLERSVERDGPAISSACSILRTSYCWQNCAA